MAFDSVSLWNRDDYSFRIAMGPFPRAKMIGEGGVSRRVSTEWVPFQTL